MIIYPFNKAPAWLIAAAAILWVIYKAVYPYIDPSHFQLQDAIIQVVLVLTGLLGVGKTMMLHMQEQIKLATANQPAPIIRNHDLQ